jgi:hypothetical protein
VKPAIQQNGKIYPPSETVGGSYQQQAASYSGAAVKGRRCTSPNFSRENAAEKLMGKESWSLPDDDDSWFRKDSCMLLNSDKSFHGGDTVGRYLRVMNLLEGP